MRTYSNSNNSQLFSLNISTSLIFALIVLSSVSQIKSLDFLEENLNNFLDDKTINTINKIDELGQLRLEFHFPVSCGLSYRNQSMISKDIVNQIKEFGIKNIDYKITTHKRNKEDGAESNFTITLLGIGDNDSIQARLIASSRYDSDKFYSILNDYPLKLTNPMYPKNYPHNPQDLINRKMFIRDLINSIL